MKPLTTQPLTTDEQEFAVALMVAVEFGYREWYGRGKELNERGLTLADLLENDDGRLAEILKRIGQTYSELRDELWDAVVAKAQEVSA